MKSSCTNFCSHPESSIGIELAMAQESRVHKFVEVPIFLRDETQDKETFINYDFNENKIHFEPIQENSNILPNHRLIK